jgi:hypothetical protein
MAQFVNDTFTDTNGTTLASHTGETGATWTLLAGSNYQKIIESNTLIAGGARGVYKASGTPASADYEVHAWQTYRGINGQDFHRTGVALRLDSSGNGYAAYPAADESSTLNLARLDSGGVPTTIASVSYTPPATGTEVKFTLRAVGSTLKVYVNDVEQISQTDSTYSAAGNAGVMLRTAWFPNGHLGINAEGWPINKLEAWDVASASISLAQIERNSITRGLNRGLS